MALPYSKLLKCNLFPPSLLFSFPPSISLSLSLSLSLSEGCFVDAGDLCGNSLVDPGEDCDCGGRDDLNADGLCLNDLCCNGTICALANTAICRSVTGRERRKGGERERERERERDGDRDRHTDRQGKINNSFSFLFFFPHFLPSPQQVAEDGETARCCNGTSCNFVPLEANVTCQEDTECAFSQICEYPFHEKERD